MGQKSDAGKFVIRFGFFIGLAKGQLDRAIRGTTISFTLYYNFSLRPNLSVSRYHHLDIIIINRYQLLESCASQYCFSRLMALGFIMNNAVMRTRKFGKIWTGTGSVYRVPYFTMFHNYYYAFHLSHHTSSSSPWFSMKRKCRHSKIATNTNTLITHARIIQRKKQWMT
jgi:hypothetical protein